MLNDQVKHIVWCLAITVVSFIQVYLTHLCLNILTSWFGCVVDVGSCDIWC